MDLIFAQDDRHRHHQGEVRRLALIVIHDTYYIVIAIADVRDLRCMIVQRGVGLADVEAAERRSRRGTEGDSDRAHYRREHQAPGGFDTSPLVISCSPFSVHSNLGAGHTMSQTGTSGAAQINAQEKPVDSIAVELPVVSGSGDDGGVHDAAAAVVRNSHWIGDHEESEKE